MREEPDKSHHANTLPHGHTKVHVSKWIAAINWVFRAHALEFESSVLIYHKGLEAISEGAYPFDWNQEGRDVVLTYEETGKEHKGNNQNWS